MTLRQAAKITVDCVRAVGNYEGALKPEFQLRHVNIRTENQILRLRQLIVNDPVIGVPSLDHTIDSKSLRGMRPSWTLRVLVLVIKEESVPTQRGRGPRAFSVRLEREFARQGGIEE